MKKIVGFILFLLISSVCLANSAPVVSNVSVIQRNDSKLVDICYNLSDADGDKCTISVQVSNDGGSTWTVTAVSFTGAVGSNISSGNGKLVVWDAGKDLPGVSGNNCRIKVTANDGVLQVQVATTGVYDYQATVVSGPIGIYDAGDTFRTFSLERGEHTSNSIFDVALDDKAINGGVGPVGDPLDTKTAFIYNEFLNGNLVGFGIGNDVASYKTMQNVIWNLEGEGSVINTATYNALIDYATANADGSNYGIKVMVMYDATGARAQDMLVLFENN